MVAVKQQLAVPGLVVLRLNGGNAKCQQLRGDAGICGRKADFEGHKANHKACKAPKTLSDCLHGPPEQHIPAGRPTSSLQQQQQSKRNRTSALPCNSNRREGNDDINSNIFSRTATCPSKIPAAPGTAAATAAQVTADSTVAASSTATPAEATNKTCSGSSPKLSRLSLTALEAATSEPDPTVMAAEAASAIADSASAAISGTSSERRHARCGSPAKAVHVAIGCPASSHTDSLCGTRLPRSPTVRSSLPSSPHMLRSSLESCQLRSSSSSPARSSSSSSTTSKHAAATSSRLVPSSPRARSISACNAAASAASSSPTMLQHRERRRVELYALNAILARNDELQVAAYLAQLRQQQQQQLEPSHSAEAALAAGVAAPADTSQHHSGMGGTTNGSGSGSCACSTALAVFHGV